MAIIEEPKEMEEWLRELPQARVKLTKLHFYFHDIASGQNPTAVKIAQAANTMKSPTFFGLVNMIDDPLTEGPEPTSRLVGRAQGLYGLASQEEISLLLSVNFVFTGGKYNGSTLTVLGHNPVMHPKREMPIVGGTGVFRLARGFATAKTVSMNSTGDAIVEYNFAVLHYSFGRRKGKSVAS
ncbi:hypothetical protein UlMin_030901 [Ulmus minor]